MIQIPGNGILMVDGCRKERETDVKRVLFES